MNSLADSTASGPLTEHRTLRLSNVSLGIPVKDAAETVTQLVDSILKQSRKPDEVIFVDGGSRDGTLDILRRICDREETFRLIEARKGAPGQGRNIAAANATFDWIAFADAGNRLDPHWLEQLIEAAGSDPEAGIVSGDFEPIRDSFVQECAGIAYLPGPDAVRGPFIASTLVRRDVWHAAGGFPDLRAAEDLVFFEEVRKKGYKFIWAAKAKVQQAMPETLLGTFRRRVLYSCVNVWARRERPSRYWLALLYGSALLFVTLAAWKSAWWLLVPLGGLLARAGSYVWLQRKGRAGLWVLNPVRIALVAAITLGLDLATFNGWIKALLKPGQFDKIRRHLRTRSGD